MAGDRWRWLVWRIWWPFVAVASFWAFIVHGGVGRLISGILAVILLSEHWLKEWNEKKEYLG